VIVLDTHAWLWLVSDPSRLGREAIEWIDRAGDIAI
jgi:PIN domain nuclease of toxin-antitoxin system